MLEAIVSGGGRVYGKVRFSTEWQWTGQRIVELGYFQDFRGGKYL